MGKQCKSKKPDKVGSGKVTPVQVAFIVDRYLTDNNYTQTLTAFRSETSTIIAGTKIKEAPKSLLSLGDILDEYISLKEQMISLNHEKASLDLEKCRVEKFLQGIQAVIQAYRFPGLNSSIPQSDQLNGLPEDLIFSELLVDISLDCTGSAPCNSALGSATDFLTNSLDESGNRGFEANATSSGIHVPSLLGILSEKDMNREGHFAQQISNSTTKCSITNSTTKSTTKCSITNSSGRKERAFLTDQENMLATR